MPKAGSRRRCSAFKTGDVTVPADVGERTSQALRQAALDRLGMEARAGNLISGADRIEAAARGGKVHLLIHAADAGDDGRKRMDQAWRVGGGGPGKLTQGMIFPEAHYLVVGTGARKCGTCRPDRSRCRFARFARACRWRAFTGPDRGLEGGEPAPEDRFG